MLAGLFLTDHVRAKIGREILKRIQSARAVYGIGHNFLSSGSRIPVIAGRAYEAASGQCDGRLLIDPGGKGYSGLGLAVKLPSVHTPGQGGAQLQ